MFNSPLKHLDFKLSPSKISKNEWISVKRWLVENTSWKKTGEKDKKKSDMFCWFPKKMYLCTRNQERTSDVL